MTKITYVSALALLIGLPAQLLLAAPQEPTEDQSAKTFQYVEQNRIGAPADVLEVKESVSQPLLQGEARIKVLAAPIHPSNLLQIAGNYLTDPVLPSTPGSEGVGRVLEVDADVKHLSKGQLVLLGGMGTWREELVAPAAMLTALPVAGESSMAVIEQLSMATINPLTALLMLTSYADVKEGDWVVQSASNSAVGGYLVQLAKQRGVKTVNIVRREGLATALKSKGADVVLIDGPDLPAQIANATNNQPVVLAIDAVGGQTFSRMAASLGEGGTIVSYGLLSGKQPTLDVGLAIAKDIRTRGFWLTKWFKTADMEAKQAAFGQIIPLIANGSLKADIDSRFNIAEIKNAVTRAGQRGRNGKVLIIPE
ncbi:MAG: zinc-dependent alcohol dehydrogenase family protein [Gammaproteobacteria bacterium]|nr:zinc-dependent alcohol dehydrogenase family protein [Gammaproteobacteria bacterium]